MRETFFEEEALPISARNVTGARVVPDRRYGPTAGITAKRAGGRACGAVPRRAPYARPGPGRRAAATGVEVRAPSGPRTGTATGGGPGSSGTARARSTPPPCARPAPPA